MTATGLFSHRHNQGARVWSAARRAQQRMARLHRFDDLIADNLSPENAARQLGFTASYGRVMLAEIRREINEVQRAAGYGDWAI